MSKTSIFVSWSGDASRQIAEALREWLPYIFDDVGAWVSGQDIQAGSQPTLTYFALLGISELIAGFALIIDSDATLIGANVVAPLMTPIFGIALGLARGDLRLLRIALIAEFGGALVGVGLCFLLGLLLFASTLGAGWRRPARP
jgi:hypothetical protein